MLPRRLRHGEEATLVEHLDELRSRLIISLIALVVWPLVAFVFHHRILHWLIEPLPPTACGTGDARRRRAVHRRRSRSASGSASLLALPDRPLAAVELPRTRGRRARPALDRWSLVVFATVLGSCRHRLCLLRRPAAGVSLPDQLRLVVLQHPDPSQGLLPLRPAACWSACAIVFELPDLRAGARPARHRHLGKLRRTWRMGYFIDGRLAVLLPGVDPVTTTLEVIPLFILYEARSGCPSSSTPLASALPISPRAVVERVPEDRAARPSRGHRAPADAARDRDAQRRRAPRRDRGGLRELYRFRDFDHFIEVWILTTNALRTTSDFRQVVVDYAERPRARCRLRGGDLLADRAQWRGVDWDEIFTGYCDGAQEARELHGVEMRLTPDITRSFPLDDAEQLVALRGEVPRPRHRRRRARRRGGPVPAGAVRAGLPLARERGSARSRTRARWPDRRRCAARSTRSAPTGSGTASARRGSRPAARARRPRHRARRLPDLEPAHRRRRLARGAPAPASSSRPASPARSRPTTRRCSTPTSRRQRGRRLARARPGGLLRGRARGRALRRRDQRAPARDRRNVRLGRRHQKGKSTAG